MDKIVLETIFTGTRDESYNTQTNTEYKVGTTL
jgi:hypothetical protein